MYKASCCVESVQESIWVFVLGIKKPLAFAQAVFILCDVSRLTSHVSRLTSHVLSRESFVFFHQLFLSLFVVRIQWDAVNWAD